MIEKVFTPAYSDADPSNHINARVYPVWFEAARNPFFEFFTPDLEPRKWELILVHIDVDMVNECFFNGDVTVKSSISKIGETSFTVYQEAHQHGKRVAKGSAVLVHYDLKNKKKLKISDAIKEKLRKHLIQTD